MAEIIMSKITRRDFTGSALATATSLAAGTRRAGAQAAKIVALGGSVPFSGAQANTGLNVYEGYQVVVKYINEKMGGFKVGGETCKLELKMIDDASDPQRAVTLIQKQIDDGIDFFLGSFSSAIVLPTVAVTERARKPMLQAGGGSDQIFTHGYKYSFGIYPRASRQLDSFIDMLKSMKPQVQSVSIMVTNDPYGITLVTGATDAIKEAGLTLIDTYKLPPTVRDVSGVLTSVRGNPPDVLIAVTHEDISQLVIQQMVATDTNVKMLHMPLGPEIEAFRKTLGKYSDELLTLQFWDPRLKYQDPIFGTTQAYYEWLKANSQRIWSNQTVAASACIICFVQAMQKAGTLDPAAVRDAIAALDFTSFYGPIKWTEQGDGNAVLMGPKVGQVQNGVMEIVHPAAAATAKLVSLMTPWAARKG
jgi:branched-chain amino acid transport system substrate-binding protein